MKTIIHYELKFNKTSSIFPTTNNFWTDNKKALRHGKLTMSLQNHQQNKKDHFMTGENKWKGKGNGGKQQKY